MIPQFLVSGMFRSGTTMLARMLHSNPQIVCAADPFAPIFKSFRNAVSAGLLNEFDLNAPLHDYYMDYRQNSLFQSIQNQEFNLKVDEDEVRYLRDRIEDHCQPYSPLITPYLSSLDGVTYEELIASAVNIINKAYGKENAKVIGFKEVWIDEFTPHFRKLCAGNKIIHLIRDPRSIIASNHASGSIYPLVFLMRQWRKSATLSWYFAENSKNVKLIRFEDLISQPEDVAVELCDFLGVEYHQNMNNPSTYLDGIGRPWHQNTSYKKNSKDNKSRQFNKTALDKWKQVLSEEVLSLIDLTCSKEMSLFGYKPVTNIESTRQCVDILNYEDNYSSCADWIKPYVSYNNFTEILAELKRLDLLESQYVLNDKVQRQLALIPSMYKVLGIKSAF